MPDGLIQGTVEWHAARLGKVTASKISDVMARTKTGPAASRKNYEAHLIAEILSGQPTEHFINDAMRWGTETEPQARAAYKWNMDLDVVEAGFVDHPSIEMSGASPDGLVGDDGLVEIKCPNTATHIDTLLSGKIPRKYVDQMLWQMECTQRQWCDFVSFDPRLPDRQSFFVKRIERDAERLEEIRAEVIQFLAEIDSKLQRLREL